MATVKRLESRYDDQFTLSTQLIKKKLFFNTPRRRSTTVSLQTYPFIRYNINLPMDSRHQL